MLVTVPPPVPGTVSCPVLSESLHDLGPGLPTRSDKENEERTDTWTQKC